MRGVLSLRELLNRPEPVVAPGAYDALSARLVEQAGFPAVYMTGFGASASLLGRPTWGCCRSARWSIRRGGSCRR
jgi:2-methylisocitrate lyase-like PEP mutase family enzyme